MYICLFLRKQFGLSYLDTFNLFLFYYIFLTCYEFNKTKSNYLITNENCHMQIAISTLHSLIM